MSQASTTMDRLLQRLRSQRQSAVEVEPGVRILVQRPAEAELAEYSGRTAFEVAGRWVVGWEGVTEATLLGAAGGSDAVTWSPELWREVIADRAPWAVQIFHKVEEMTVNHLRIVQETRGN